MRLNVIVLLVLGAAGLSAHATSLNCQSESAQAKREFSLQTTAETVRIASTVTVKGAPVPTTYVIFSHEAACGQPLDKMSDCIFRELDDARSADIYDFIFHCPDGRNGDIHYEKNAVVAYCYQGTKLLRQSTGQNCTLTR
ncbi:MAG: hypothetical protein AB7N80_01600 [Bdellovibrionales bacterium]